MAIRETKEPVLSTGSVAWKHRYNEDCIEMKIGSIGVSISVNLGVW